ncbi:MULTISPECIES: cyanophycinase [unclassified Duganella]|uniref:cyanophycinase n=1 Tax=unclassified Duganella TaxID=2636909 RepID=UPI000873C93B|nr:MULTISPECIES: cyanophycinase [unclassified Duganella]
MERDKDNGHLVIIGGHEDRTQDKTVLKRFVDLAGGSEQKIVVISAASSVADEMWKIYDAAFADLGVTRRVHLEVHTREDANADNVLRELSDADGIFMTGGDQKRLLANIGGTALDRALHQAYQQRGACIGGTSAGASAMSGHMLATGHAGLQPEKGAVNMGAGLGLVQGVVIDQHFSERHRLARLLTVVAQNPYLQGIGIDEDTALVISRGRGIEVVGQGAVTIVDGRSMHSNMADVPGGGCPQLVDVRLHLLPGGSAYDLPAAGAEHAIPAALLDFLHLVTKRIDYHENH